MDRLPGVMTLLLLLCSAAPHSAAPAGSSYLPTSGAPAADAGPYGDFLCDSPYSLIQSALGHMAALTQQHDFIIWTGDSPPHVPVDQLSTDTVIQVLSNMTQTIRQHFPNLTVYPALGNHDYWPQDQMPTSTNAVYRAAAELWSCWLEPDALLTLSQGDVSENLFTIFSVGHRQNSCLTLAVDERQLF
ncbi:hypothetical protein INR49_010458 [Caranx melampygus]|nr:hypothetical protein INR49_010458 [Caranx melampygus]